MQALRSQSQAPTQPQGREIVWTGMRSSGTIPRVMTCLERRCWTIHRLVCTDGTPCSTHRLGQQRCYLPDSEPRCNDCQCRCVCFHDLPTLNIILHYETRTEITYDSWTDTMIRCSYDILRFTFLGGNLAIPIIFLSAPVLDYWSLEFVSFCYIYPYVHFCNKSTVTLSSARIYGPFCQ